MKLRDTAERRPITILHCDLVNSTYLVDKLDPEEFLGLVEQFLDLATRIIKEHHGTVAGFTGDGIEAYYGYQGATETPAVDAIASALRIRNAMTSNQLSLPCKLHCRIGVATGVAVIGAPENEVLGRRLMAFGSVAHLAERLQSAAQPDQVYIDTKTRLMAEQHFSFCDVGPSRLKGFEHDIEIFEVVDQINHASRFDFSAQHSVPITGRQHILDLLRDRWKLALGGEGQVVHLIGDAGIGKSRALYEFEKSVSEQNVLVLRFQCSSQHSSSPLHPWINQLPKLANFQRSDSELVRREKTRVYLEEKLRLSKRLVDLSSSLLGIDGPAQSDKLRKAPPSALLSELQTELVNHLVLISRKIPVLVLLEDVQWIDATSANGFTAITELANKEAIFIGVTSRPGSENSTPNPHVTSLSLVKLSDSEVRQFIALLEEQANSRLHDSAIEQIVQRCDGNPLYIEELTSMMLALPESEMRLLGMEKRLQVPMTLQMSLLSRLDRMSQGRDLAQIAAVYGDSFSLEQIQTIAGIQYSRVSEGLAELVNSNILRLVQSGDDPHYEFRHSLLQDAVYGSLLHSRREQIHRDIAGELQSRSHGVRQPSPDIIAYHFEWANDGKSAFNYWVQAGERALRTGATTEAITLLERAHEYVEKVRVSTEGLAALQRMYMTKGLAINAVHGPRGNPGKQFELASAVGEQLGDVESTVEALDWQFGVAFNSGRLDQCTEPATRLVRLGRRSNNRNALLAGTQALGLLYFNQGRFQDAENQFSTVLDKVPNVISGEHCFPSLTLSYYAWAKCMLSDRQSAFDLAERAIASSRLESDHAQTIALSNCSFVYHSLGAFVLFKQCNAELIEHCFAKGEFVYSLRAAMIRDCLLAKETRSSSLLPSIIENLNALIEAGEEVETTYLYLLLAEVQTDLGLFDQALDSLFAGLAVANKNGEMFCFVQLNRMMAQVLAHCPKRTNTMAPSYYLEQAASVAAQQGTSRWATQAKQYKFTSDTAKEFDRELH